jgi:site-specific DNA-methyltransferase (adenine-specific)
MLIRGQQRVTHSASERLSGRAREVAARGFAVLRYHPAGPMPGDVWHIVPEDTHRRDAHEAPFPEDLCRLPILAASAPGDLVLDPFCGRGTTLKVAAGLGRRAVGIDLARGYLEEIARLG